MRSLVSGVFVSVSLVLMGVADEAQIARWHESFAKDIRPVLEAKCLSCHSGEKMEGDFDLGGVLTAARPIDHAAVWDRVAVRVRLNEMPPAGSPGLSDPEKGALHHWSDSRPAFTPRSAGDRRSGRS